MNLTRDAVLTETPNFLNVGLLYIHTPYGLRFVFIPTTRVRTPRDGSKLLLPGHRIGEVTLDRVIRMGSEQDYNSKNDFEIGGKIKILGAKIIL